MSSGSGRARRAEREPAPQVFISGNPVNRVQEAFIPRNGVIGEIEAQIMLAAGCPRPRLVRPPSHRQDDRGQEPRRFPAHNGSRRQHLRWRIRSPPPRWTTSCGLSRKEWQPRGPWCTRLSRADLTSLFALLAQADDRLTDENRRLIVAIDEYEFLDEKIGEGIFPRELLATIRASIQTHRRIIWMFAGSHDISELSHAQWPSYLVSARTIEMPLFTEAETRLLLTEPLAHSPLFRNDEASRPHFAVELWGDGGIERIHAEAAGLAASRATAG